ncbi:GspE/PulE family protein [Treponema brennaborense]|uniref:Type II secretion system protein E n=1 Tax=Treponema brennaborense (strain DSM 12168 / CIP 105900 / DD5/3) TaxID=906968 RepID=F4LM64_TREBD|nr:GspE/PulE family protein [Treponema brennaborense]AEE16743.1 type II secretion system protein E [Treponema brennaborense DSM 12168]
MMNKYLLPDFCNRNRVIILANEEHALTIGMVHPENTVLRKRIERYFGQEKTIAFRKISAEDFEVRMSRFFAGEYGFDSSDTDKTAGGVTPDAGGTDILTTMATDSPIVNLLNSIFLEGVACRASDIHIESAEQLSRVRYRTDGRLRTALVLDTDKAAALISRVKLLANLNVLEKRRPQDGRLQFTRNGHDLDVRISILPSVYGESAVLRLLDTGARPLVLDELGFSVPHTALIRKLLSTPYGLILVTGPTGSGKTTTLAAFLAEINTPDIKIISVEDPVEYRIPGILQIQTDENADLTFDVLLKRILRHDPDIIMVGEIRDESTAELAVRMALTGHLVFATLHTNTTAETPLRLCNMGIAPYLIAAVLKGIIAQRLLLKKNGKGRTVAAEILAVDQAAADIIAAGCDRNALTRYLQDREFLFLEDDIEEKIKNGIIEDAYANKYVDTSLS